MQRLVRAKAEHDEALAAGGFNYGFHGDYLASEVERCSEDFGRRLDDLITARCLALIDEAGRASRPANPQIQSVAGSGTVEPPAEKDKPQ